MNRIAIVRSIAKQSAVLMLGVCLFTACGGDPAAKKERLIVVSTNSDKTVSIDTFTELPPEIDGCAGYYSSDEKEFGEKKYLYANDMGNQAFVKINGVLTKFTLSKPDTTGKSQSMQIWTNKDYELTIVLKTIRKVDEVLLQEGVLILKPKKGQAVVKKIYGECGC